MSERWKFSKCGAHGPGRLECLEKRWVHDGLVSGQAGRDGVISVHHFHLWAIDEHRASLEAHVVTDHVSGPEAEREKARIKQMLAARFHIEHTTLELEYPVDPSCDHG